MTTLYGSQLLECDICGLEDRDVRSGLACYASDGRFERVDRCMDHQSCRRRVEADREWPLLDITDRIEASR